MKIADAHHHLWDLENNRYPWLQEPVEHFAGDYSDIRRTYLIGDLHQDAAEFELSKSVHLQAEFDHSDPVGETAWLQSVHDDPASGDCLAPRWRTPILKPTTSRRSWPATANIP